MANTVIVGAQWGDEGKGKIVDFLTESADVVVRAQGGNNAGHTVINGDKKYVLHLIPSGILWPSKTCVIGNGVVLDPTALVKEIDQLASQGVEASPDNLLISERAHLTLPYHLALDRAREAQRGDRKIGTTGRGIGPTYSEKIQRSGLRVADLKDPIIFAQRYADRVAETNEILDAAGLEQIDAESTGREILAAAERLLPFVADTVSVLHRALAEGKSFLFEGAQGTYLDIDHGTYPFVTSSNTTSGGAATGSGVPPTSLGSVVGVMKAYTTRVGEGPFATEDDALGQRFHEMGREFGATTGRARRCGWLDLVLLRYASMVNGFDQLAVTNLDGLDDLETIKVCTGYQLDGTTLTTPPATVEDFARCTPLYDELPGWSEPTTGARSFDELPSNARAYLDRVSGDLGVPVTLVGVGPDRSQTLRA